MQKEFVSAEQTQKNAQNLEQQIKDGKLSYEDLTQMGIKGKTDVTVNQFHQLQRSALERDISNARHMGNTDRVDKLEKELRSVESSQKAANGSLNPGRGSSNGGLRQENIKSPPPASSKILRADAGDGTPGNTASLKQDGGQDSFVSLGNDYAGSIGKDEGDSRDSEKASDDLALADDTRDLDQASNDVPSNDGTLSDTAAANDTTDMNVADAHPTSLGDSADGGLGAGTDALGSSDLPSGGLGGADGTIT